MPSIPPQVSLLGKKQYRIIPSVYPTINFFEDLVDPDEMETLFAIESLTNERLRQEVGDLFLVPPADRISGPGASVIMAAFTHVSTSAPSRFTDGSYGVYYASMTKNTAIHETVYHRENFLRATNQHACELTMRVYEGTIKKTLYDVRESSYSSLHHPNNYATSQAFGKKLRDMQAWGIIYQSVRHPQGECIAAFRPRAITPPIVIGHLRYIWNGKNITDVLDTRAVEIS